MTTLPRGTGDLARQRLGMTLIEVLVSLSIGAMIIAAVLGVLSSGQRARDQGETRSDLFQAARITLSQMERDLRATVFRANDANFTFTGTDQEQDGIPSDELDFASAAGSPAAAQMPTSSLVRVKYAIGNLRQSPQPGLMREELALPLLDNIPPEQEELATRMYCPGAIGLDIRYFEPTQQQWVDEWQDTTTLPSAVQVTLYIVPPTTDQQAEPRLDDMMPFTTTVRLMLAGAPLGGTTSTTGAGTSATGGTPSSGLPNLSNSPGLSGGDQTSGPGGGP